MNHIFNLSIKHLTVITACLLMTACADDARFDDTSLVPATEGALSIPFEVEGEMPLARGIATQSHETKLDQVYLLFFDCEDEDRFVDVQSVAVGSGKKKFSFDPPEHLNPNHDYRVLAVGNSDKFAAGTSMPAVFQRFIDNDYDYASVDKELAARYDGAITTATPSRLPMWGKFLDSDGMETLFRFSRDEHDNAVSETGGVFKFSRAVCRVDIHNLVGHVLDIRYARLVNTNTHGSYFHDVADEPTIAEFWPEEAPDGDGYMPVTVDMVPGENTTQRLEGSLYTFPNIVGTCTVNDNVSTALMIAGYYIDPEDPEHKKDDHLTYYRFNLSNSAGAQMLQRNFCYRATIKGVKRRGADDEKTAYNDSQPVFEYDIDDEWDAADDNFISDKDGNFLVVNRSHLTFPGEVSEADFVELRVSTNPELQWDIEWVNQVGNENEKFSCTRLSDTAIKCGPLEMNTTDYVRYGYLRIVAKNPTTGTTLSLPIYLMQMSTIANVKTLTVNGNTGTFMQELNPMGGSVSFEVMTGSPANAWNVTDDGNALTNWDTQGVKFTKHGSNRTVLEITVPSNMTGERRAATLIVSLADNELNEDGSKKVPDVVINLIQDPSPSLLDVIGMPTSGTMDIECFSLGAGNPNAVVNPHEFIVKLADTRLRYSVSSTFDYNRDLILSSGAHRGPGSNSPVTASHPTDGAVNTNQVISGLQSGVAFWVNPFRTGPNDPTITGTITVKAYMPDDATITPEERSFTIRLTSTPVEINDVFIPNGTGYILIADRNYGAPSRVAGDGTEIEAQYYDYRSYVKVTGRVAPVNNTSFKGTILTETSKLNSSSTGPSGFASLVYSPTKANIVSQFTSGNAHVNELYKTLTWRIISNTMTGIPTYIRWSKQRPFFVSSLVKKDGRRVCCWMPIVNTQRYATKTSATVVPHYALEQNVYYASHYFHTVGLNTNPPSTFQFEDVTGEYASDNNRVMPTETYVVRLCMSVPEASVALAKEIYDLQ